MSKQKLSKWLKTNLKNNSLLQLDPSIKKTAANKQKALQLSIKGLLGKNKQLQKEYEMLNMWLAIAEKERENKRKLNVIDETKHALFKRTRISSSMFNVSYGTVTAQKNSGTSSFDHESGKDLQKRNIQDKQKLQEIKSSHKDIQNEHESSPLIPQKFSFSPSEQGSYVEPILQHVEKALFRFIVNHENYIPFETAENFAAKCNPPRQDNFSDVDLLGILNFIIQNITLFTTGQSNQTLFHGEHKLNPTDLFRSFKMARNHNAHAITQPMGRWSDEDLQWLSILALKVIVCLGDKESYELLVKIKHELNSKLIERMILMKEETDTELADLVDFALNIINKLKLSKEHKKQILKLAMDKDNTFVTIWKCLVSQKDENAKIKKFITIMNIQFDMDLEIKI